MDYDTSIDMVLLLSIGQSGAVRLGITRALDLLDPSLRPILRQGIRI